MTGTFKIYSFPGLTSVYVGGAPIGFWVQRVPLSVYRGTIAGGVAVCRRRQGWGYLRAAGSANLSSSGRLTTIGSGSERVTTQTVGRSVDALIS
jgi:hypothetical protein